MTDVTICFISKDLKRSLFVIWAVCDLARVSNDLLNLFFLITKVPGIGDLQLSTIVQGFGWSGVQVRLDGNDKMRLELSIRNNMEHIEYLKAMFEEIWFNIIV